MDSRTDSANFPPNAHERDVWPLYTAGSMLSGAYAPGPCSSHIKSKAHQAATLPCATAHVHALLTVQLQRCNAGIIGFCDVYRWRKPVLAAILCRTVRLARRCRHCSRCRQEQAMCSVGGMHHHMRGSASFQLLFTRCRALLPIQQTSALKRECRTPQAAAKGRHHQKKLITTATTAVGGYHRDGVAVEPP